MWTLLFGYQTDLILSYSAIQSNSSVFVIVKKSEIKICPLNAFRLSVSLVETLYWKAPMIGVLSLERRVVLSLRSKFVQQTPLSEADFQKTVLQTVRQRSNRERRNTQLNFAVLIVVIKINNNLLAIVCDFVLLYRFCSYRTSPAALLHFKSSETLAGHFESFFLQEKFLLWSSATAFSQTHPAIDSR